MKGSRIYMILLFLFLVIVFLFEYMSPHIFVWKPTYDKNDKEPFGSYVFDDIASSSVENYSVVNKTFYQIIQDDPSVTRHAFLLTEQALPFNLTDIESLYKLIHQGNQVMLCTEKFPDSLKDTLYFETKIGGYLQSLDIYVQKQNERDSIFFGTDTLNPERIYKVYPHIHAVNIIPGKSGIISDEEASDNTFEDDGSSIEIQNKTMPINCDSMEVLVWNDENKPLVLRVFIGEGEIFLVSTPLMFTNYGLLDGDNATYAFRLLSYMKGKPLIRIEAYGDHSGNSQSPLRYLLSEPPLRWAVYFSMILIMLFMVFAAKRRQRIIPVVNAPPNKTLEFMSLISNLYFQKHNNEEILRMKHTYFCAEIKRFTGIDLQENTPNEQDNKRLIEKTGLEMIFISGLLKNIRMALYRSEVDDIRLKQYVDGMNCILKALGASPQPPP